MSKYRFKTKEEFIKDGIPIDFDHGNPRHWNSNMSEYLGRDVPVKLNDECDKGERISFDGWVFYEGDYVLKEENNTNGFEYFGDTLMEVSNDGISWKTRVVFGKKENRYIAWPGRDNLEEAKHEYLPVSWNHARSIKTKLTLQEIADKFGLDKNEIEIVDYEEE